MSKNLPEKPKPGKVTHGIYGWLRSGKINPSVRGFKRLQRYLRDIERDLIADLGGPDSLTAAKEVLIKSTIQAYGVLLLAGAYTQKYSILDPIKARRGVLELQPVLGHQFIAFLNCVRQNLLALGLDRRKADEVLDVQAYIREFDARKAQDAEGPGKEAEEGEKTQPASSGREGQGNRGES